jgi:CubicO group peptidase (beta-lactamase class C family)
MRRFGIAILARTVACATQTPERSITRLDGSRISIPNASKLAREILTAQHITGAQVAVVDRGQLVWSEAFGMRWFGSAAPDGANDDYVGSVDHEKCLRNVCDAARRAR